MAAAIGSVAVMTGITGGAASVAADNCAPGSGPNFAGKHLTSGNISAQQNLQCANLTGADLSGLSLIQVDFTGAVSQEREPDSTPTSPRPRSTAPTCPEPT